MTRLRTSEYVPAPREPDARLLRGLPESWSGPIVESAVDALLGRARGVIARLDRLGCGRAATDLRRRVQLLERIDELHRHASSLETLVGIVQALASIRGEGGPASDQVLAQTGLLEGDWSGVAGPALRETAMFRNRAFRWLAAGLAAYARAARRGVS